MRPMYLLITLGLAGSGLACSDHEFHPPDREEQVAAADSLFSPAMFDTIRWESDSARVFVGNETYAAECRRCHGFLGRADTDYAEAQGLEVPSLVEEDWRFAGDIDGLRRIIFTGHPRGMPTWGVAGISPREIDAVAFYILVQLRPDALGES